jgi:hypothetical protein
MDNVVCFFVFQKGKKMKLRVCFKTPDWDDQLKEYFLDKEEEVLKVRNALSKKWLEYSEYITIEFDTELGTARVCER